MNLDPWYLGRSKEYQRETKTRLQDYKQTLSAYFQVLLKAQLDHGVIGYCLKTIAFGIVILCRMADV